MSFTGSSSSGDQDPAFKVSIRLRTFPITKPKVEEPDAPEIKIVYVEVEEEFIRLRKKQLALTVLTGVGMLGICLGICVNCACGRKPESSK